MTTVAVLIGRDPPLRYSVHRGYAHAVWEVGATPVLLVPPSVPAALDRVLSVALACDAVCVTGGGDVDPGHYGEPPASRLMDVDPSRGETEMGVVRTALQVGKRVRGICRGIQLVAVALGGALHQDLPQAGFSGHWEEERQFEPVHRIIADPAT